MSNYHKDPADFTPDELPDPSLNGEDLRQIAAQRPDLWSAILNHPNIYPDLSVYIHQGMQHNAPPPPPPPGPQHQPYEMPDSTEYQRPFYGTPGYSAEPPLTATDEKTWGVVMPLGAIIFGFLSPLIIWLIFRDRSPLLDAQGRYALNWTISHAIYSVAAWILSVILIGYVLLAILALLDLVFLIIAAVKAGERKAWKYPLSIPFFDVQSY